MYAPRLLPYLPFIFIFVVCFALTDAEIAHADSPPNLNSDILWTDTGGVFDPANNIFTATFNGPTDIEAAFNHGRRQEEIQLGLANGTLGNLSLPANYSSLSDDEKALLLINEERTARAGMQAGVIGLPLEQVYGPLDAVAQDYAQHLITNDLWGHHHNGNPNQRLNAGSTDLALACRESLAHTENLAAFYSPGSIPLSVERAIYGWIYEDEGSNWGHREAVLLQDKPLGSTSTNFGYKNNTGAAGSEGYLGIGVASGPYEGWANGTVVVMNIIDPNPANCQKRRQDMTESLGAISYDPFPTTVENPDPNGPPIPMSLGTLRIEFNFLYNGTPPLNDVFFIVTQADKSALLDMLPNSQGRTEPGGWGAKMVLWDFSLPGNDNQLNQNETLTVPFHVGIDGTPWGLNFDMYATDGGVNAASVSEPLARFTLDSSMFDLERISQRQPVLFLPLIGQ